MRRLKDLIPGHIIFIIVIRFQKDGQYENICIMKRKVIKIKQNNLLDTMIDFHLDHTSGELNHEVITFTKEHMESHSFKSSITNLYEVIYCFSEESFVGNFKELTKKIKKALLKKHIKIRTDSYYKNFITNVMRFIYNNKSDLTDIGLRL